MRWISRWRLTVHLNGQREHGSAEVNMLTNRRMRAITNEDQDDNQIFLDIWLGTIAVGHSR